MSISSATFTYVADLVRRESALVLEPGKEYLVAARLLPLARAAGCRDVDEYVARLHTLDRPVDRDAVVTALTTNETSWFRDREPFDVLVSTVLPEVMGAARHRRRITLWSAGCSSGQEAYTLAMLMAEHLVPHGFSADIVASDISPTMLARTRAGSYSQMEVERGLPPALLDRHFTRSGDRWQIDAGLRSMVRVQHLNLAAEFPPLPTFDIVFLRNVLIYFDPATKAEVLARVRRVMDPEGYLFLGGAETTMGVDESWLRLPYGRCTVNRPGPAAAGAASGESRWPEAWPAAAPQPARPGR